MIMTSSLVSSPYGPLISNATLFQTPMVMANNAASVYMQRGSLLSPNYLYGKHQEAPTKSFGVGTFSDLLNCGARALDLEIFDDFHSDVAFMHGMLGKIGDISLVSGLQDIKSWSNEFPEELVLLSVDCTADKGEKCSHRVRHAFKESGVEFITNCDKLRFMTVDQALKKGPVLAISDTCIDQNADETLTCHGFMPSVPESKANEIIDWHNQFLNTTDAVVKFTQSYNEAREKWKTVQTYSCWEVDSNKNLAIQPFLAYLEKETDEHSSSVQMWNVQGIWQVNNQTPVLGLMLPRPLPEYIGSLIPSSIIGDTTKSSLNKIVFDYIQKKGPQGFNLVAVDDVCSDFGKKIIGALRPITETKSPTTESKSPTTAPQSSSKSHFSFQHIFIFIAISSLVMM